MKDDILEDESAGTTTPADVNTPAYEAHTDGEHSHTHEHGAFGRHSHQHGHESGEQAHSHDQEHPLHADHPDHPLYHPGG